MLLLLGVIILLASIMTMVVLKQDNIRPEAPITAMSGSDGHVEDRFAVDHLGDSAGLSTAESNYDEAEETRVAARMQALTDSVPSPLPYDIKHVDAGATVNPVAGLQRMAESSGMTVGEDAFAPTSREAFMRDNTPTNHRQR
jgi:hypothetical protein